MLRQVFSYMMAGALGLFLAVNASAAGPAADAAAIISELGLREAATPLSRQPGWSPEKVVITAPGFFTQVVPDYRERLHAVAGDVELVFDTSGEFVPGADLLAGADGFRIERTARWLRDKALEGPMGELNTGSVWADEVPPARIAQSTGAIPEPRRFTCGAATRCMPQRRRAWPNTAPAEPSRSATIPKKRIDTGWRSVPPSTDTTARPK